MKTSKPLKVTLLSVSDPGIYGNPLALGCLKTYADSVLKKRAAVTIKECLIAASLQAPGSVAAAILGDKPSVVGFSCYTWNVLAVISLCRELKKISPATRIILGGADATARGAAVLKDSSADILVRGEGELTFAELLSRFIAEKPWAGTPGTISLAAGRPVEGPPRPLIENLDIIPSPYLAGLFDSKKYHYMVQETSRGCPFKCTYCVWANRSGVRFFSLERARKEIDWLAEHAPRDSGQQFDPDFFAPETDEQAVPGTFGGGQRPGADIFRVFVTDQDLVMQGPRALDILRHVRSAAAGRNVRWIVHGDLRYWNRATAVAANSAKFLFCFGIQSVDPRVLKLAGRVPPAPAVMKERMALVKKHAPEVNVLFQLMLGLPGDTRKGFLKSLRWGLKACGRIQPPGRNRLLRAGVQIFHTAVFPNTKLEQDAGKLGMEWDRNPPYLIKSMNSFTDKDLDRCYKEIKALELSTSGISGHSRIIIGAHGRQI